MSKKLSTVQLFLLSLALVLIVAGLSQKFASDPDTKTEANAVGFLAEPRPLSDFNLVGEDLKPFGLEQIHGHLNIIFFGYTYCPDVCPTSLGDLGQAFTLLEESATKLGNMRGIFISVDGNRDKPETLAEYTDYFHPAIFGATGAKEEVDKLVKKSGAVYRFEKPAIDDPQDYHITHSSAFFVVDAKAQLVDVIVDHKDPELLSIRLKNLQRKFSYNK